VASGPLTHFIGKKILPSKRLVYINKSQQWMLVTIQGVVIYP